MTCSTYFLTSAHYTPKAKAMWSISQYPSTRKTNIPISQHSENQYPNTQPLSWAKKYLAARLYAPFCTNFPAAVLSVRRPALPAAGAELVKPCARTDHLLLDAPDIIAGCCYQRSGCCHHRCCCADVLMCCCRRCCCPQASRRPAAAAVSVSGYRRHEPYAYAHS